MVDLCDICEVPCSPVDKKLSRLVPWITFAFILGGLGVVLAFFGGSIMSSQDKMVDQVAILSTKVETQNIIVRNMEASIIEIKHDMRRTNGQSGGN